MFDGYSVASGSVDITPQRPIPLAGYATLRKPTFDRVADPLEANVVILRSCADTIVLIALDLMYVGGYLQDEILKALDGQVRREAVFATAVHTHSGPPTDDSLPILGRVTPEYRSFVARLVSELALRLLNGPFVPVRLEYLEGLGAHSVNRRKKVFGISRNFPFIGSHVRIKPNLSGRRDDTIRMIRMRDGAGHDVALCWSYACHPVGFPALNELSSEYPGYVRNMLRATFGHIPVVFWQGFSANIAPLQGTPARGVASSPMIYSLRASSLQEWQHWARGLGQCVINTACDQGSAVRGPMSCSLRTLPLHELGLSSEKQLQLHEIRLGRDLAICGLNAEVAIEYVEVLRALRTPARVIPIGCVGDVFGYLPVDAMVREGGYEARGFVRRFGLRGEFVPNVSAVVTERLLRAAPESEPSKAQRAPTEQCGAGVVKTDSDCRTATRTIDV
jgi:hypothetical protein